MKRICTALLMTAVITASATTDNIAPLAKATASSTAEGSSPAAVNDGVARINGKGEWASDAKETFWGEIDFPWVCLDWEQPVEIGKLLLYDRSATDSHAAGVTLHFSDGSKIDAGGIPEDGSPLEVVLPGIKTDYVKVEVTDGYGDNIGFSEIEVYPTPGSATDYVAMVDPYIETTRGRYFFFISGCQPQGMIGAAPLTRNKNQGGGGYNYNDSHILGFPQIHAWMLSGLTLMPSTTEVDPSGGEQAWKSRFHHEGEVVRPGYHRLYLEDPRAWVEQTSTMRSSFYRVTYSDDREAALLLNLGGHVGTSTMVDADVKAVSDRRLEGSFNTVGRLWGGPDSVKVYFVAEFDRPFSRLDSWNHEGVMKDVKSMQSRERSIPRNEGMSYHDAPSAGLRALFDVKAGEPICLKMAISYVSTENAALNLATESSDRDFDSVAAASRAEWNDWFSRIDVKGGSEQQRVKFYTDLWHTLLGRHRIDDVDGRYPDRTDGARKAGKDYRKPEVRIRQVPMDKDGKPLFGMYNSDALWLTQWNQNALWGMAWPSLLDAFSASMLQYAENGGLIPRGPCGGGYSFIMSGCPATSMVTSAYQRGLHHKWNPKKALAHLIRNHEKGGMLSYNYDKDFDFYEREGYAPERGGLTVEWTFEDWALSQMAEKLGRKRDAEKYLKRSEGWRKCIHPDQKLLLPKRSDGSWLHTDPLSGRGYEEANAWQTTFGLSHDLPGLAEAMGGSDTLTNMLNYAFEMSANDNFIGSYGNGYVSYGNQPGLSTAHVFSHVGKPWLTQYWVRQVADKAYGSISPYHGYGEHDEDQGQMSGVSALMGIGLFAIDGCSGIAPYYDITSPVFDEVTITLDKDYYKGKEFKIITHNNSPENCYIRKATLNGEPWNSYRLPHERFAEGGVLELWLGDNPNTEWGTGN